MQTGRKILNLRRDRGISQQDLARACEITPSALSKIEAGINSPRAGIIWRIASRLGVTVEYLLDETMPYPYPGSGYRERLASENLDPESTTSSELTLREKAFLDALRDSNTMAEEIAYSLPDAPVETLRMVHFLIHHSRIDNPDPEFLEHFERLVTTGAPKLEPPGDEVDAEPASADRKRTPKAAPKKPRTKSPAGRVGRASKSSSPRPTGSGRQTTSPRAKGGKRRSR